MTARRGRGQQRSRRPGAPAPQQQAQAAAATVSPVPARLLGALVVLCVAVAVWVLTYHPVSDPDTWFHLSLGQFIREHSTLPHTDPFSYTAGDTPYRPSGWLTAVLMAWLDAFYPESSLGPILMVTAACAVAAGLVLWRGWRSGTVVTTGLLLMVGLLLAASRLSPRPDVWSLAGVVALLFLLMPADAAASEDTPPRAIRLWLLVPLMIFWANLHAGVIVALPFLATAAAWYVWRWVRTRLAGWLWALIPVLVACVAWLANPYGWGPLALAWHISQIPQVGWVLEWMPWYRSGFPLPWPMLVCSLLLAGAAVALVGRRWRTMHPLVLVWLVILTGLALWQRRQLGLFGVGVPLLLAPYIGGAEAWLRRGRSMLAFIAPLSLAAITAFLQITGANGNGGGWPGYGRNCAVLPCITADFLASNPVPQPIFNSYNQGGYLLHVLYPGAKVFIDGRLDVYPSQVWLDMLAVEEGRLRIDDLVTRYGMKSFVVPVADSFGDPLHLANRLAARPDYALVHLDDVSALFVRRTPETAAWLDVFGFKVISPWNLDAMLPALRQPESRQQLVNEVSRLIQQSGQSATANALAAYVAYRAGDLQTYREWLQAAVARQPDNRLLHQVQARARP